MDFNVDLHLASLPETVKRNILAHLGDRNSETQHERPFNCMRQPLPIADPPKDATIAQQLLRKQLSLPLLAAGAAVVDGVLLPTEVKAVCNAVEAWLSHRGRRPGMGSSKTGGRWHDTSSRGDVTCWVNATELEAAGQSLLAACLHMLASLQAQLLEQGFDASGRLSCQLACYPGGGARYVRHTDASSSAPDRSVTALLYLNPDWNPEVDGGQLALYNAAHGRHMAGDSSTHAAGVEGPSSSTGEVLNSNGQGDENSLSCAGVGPQRCSHSHSHSSCMPDTATHPTQPAAARPASSSGHAAGDGYLRGEPALLVSPLGGRLLVFDASLPHEVLPAHKHRYSITAWFFKGNSSSEAPAAELDTAAMAPAAAPADPCSQADGGRSGAAAEHRPPAADAAGTEADERSAHVALVTPGQQQHTNNSTMTATSPDAAAGTTPGGPGSAPPVAPSLGPRPPSSTATGGAAVAPCTHAAAAAASSVANTPTQLPTIFVSIAAFRDEECQWTLRDLFLQASQPQRVFVGVVWQVDPQEDAAFVRMAGGSRTAQYVAQVREVRCHYSTAAGPCTARSMAQQLWAGEDYVLQVDSHMRFVQGWDQLCIHELAAAQHAAGHERVVLSTYPLGYDGQGAAAAVPVASPPTLLCGKEFDTAGLLRIQSRCLAERPAGPLPSFFWAAGFSFGPSSWLVEVPYCPHLHHLFFGEEQYMLLRMWTRGWDMFAPSQPLAFHQWERSVRSKSYQACIKVDAAARAAAQALVLGLVHRGAAATSPPAGACAQGTRALLHHHQTPTEQDWEMGGVWGLGTARTVAAFEQQAGVFFQKRTLEPRALYGGQNPTGFQD